MGYLKLRLIYLRYGLSKQPIMPILNKESVPYIRINTPLGAFTIGKDKIRFNLQASKLLSRHTHGRVTVVSPETVEYWKMVFNQDSKGFNVSDEKCNKAREADARRLIVKDIGLIRMLNVMIPEPRPLVVPILDIAPFPDETVIYFELPEVSKKYLEDLANREQQKIEERKRRIDRKKVNNYLKD
jgi:hypothetical protein